eukprot:g4241.t1
MVYYRSHYTSHYAYTVLVQYNLVKGQSLQEEKRGKEKSLSRSPCIDFSEHPAPTAKLVQRRVQSPAGPLLCFRDAFVPDTRKIKEHFVIHHDSQFH